MKVKRYSSAGNKLGEIEIDAEPFGGKVFYRTLKDAVVMYQANLRQGTAKVKGRSEVHGSGKKPWKQKHTGRARAGDKKSPLWRGGGTIFGPHIRDFSYHMPAQARRVALRSAIAGKIKDSELCVAALPKLDAPSSKAARRLLQDLGTPRRALVVLDQANPTVWKSFRNFPGVGVKTAAELNALDVIGGGLIVIEDAALDALSQRVGIKAKVDKSHAGSSVEVETAPKKSRAAKASVKKTAPKQAPEKPSAPKKLAAPKSAESKSPESKSAAPKSAAPKSKPRKSPEGDA